MPWARGGVADAAKLLRRLERNEPSCIDLTVLDAIQRHARDRLEPGPSCVADNGRDLVEPRPYAGHLVLDALRRVQVAAKREHVAMLAQHGEHVTRVGDSVAIDG